MTDGPGSPFSLHVAGHATLKIIFISFYLNLSYVSGLGAVDPDYPIGLEGGDHVLAVLADLILFKGGVTRSFWPILSEPAPNAHSGVAPSQHPIDFSIFELDPLEPILSIDRLK